jgi:hypothetical protein
LIPKPDVSPASTASRNKPIPISLFSLPGFLYSSQINSSQYEG